MQKTIDRIVGVLATAALLNAFGGCTSNNPPATIPQNILSSISGKYRELGEKESGQASAWISWCINGIDEIFEVVEAGGGMYVRHFYSKGGRYVWSEAFNPGRPTPPNAPIPKPPININEYECRVIKEFGDK